MNGVEVELDVLPLLEEPRSELRIPLRSRPDELELPEPVTANAYEANARPLPCSLEEATALLKQSYIAKELLGQEFVDHFVRTREWEVRQYQRAVTDWELQRYFEII